MTTQGALSRKKKKIRFTQDTVFDIVVAAALLLIIVIMAYPIYFVFVASFSDPAYVNNGSMLLCGRRALRFWDIKRCSRMPGFGSVTVTH